MRLLSDHEWRERFFSKIEKLEGGCWIWKGPVRPNGYGYFCGRRDQKFSAHRRCYEYLVGKIPPGMVLCHRCDNVRCVNPDHLFPGSQKQNIRDSIEKGRAACLHNPPPVSPRGPSHHNATLSTEEVRRLRNLYQEGASRVGLARTFRVSLNTVYCIGKGLSRRFE